MNFFKDLKVGYEAGRIEAYSGRASKLDNQYWHQEIAVAHVKMQAAKKTLILVWLVTFVMRV